MSEPNWESVADAAYMAFGLATRGANYRGEPMPDWSSLSERTREAWRQASIAAALATGQIEPDALATLNALRSELEKLRDERSRELNFQAYRLRD